MNKEILKKTSKDTGFDLDTVDHVNRYIWKYLRELMKRGKFEGLMLKGFGTFGVDPYSKKKIIEKHKENWNPAELSKQRKERNRERMALWLAQQSASKSDLERETKDM